MAVFSDSEEEEGKGGGCLIPLPHLNFTRPDPAAF